MKLVKFLLVVIMVVAMAVVAGCGGSQSSKNTQKVTPKETSTIDQASFNELKESYNKVLSKTLQGLYEGCRFRGQDFVVIYVNSNWYNLNKGEKEVVVDRAVRTYAGMYGARGLKLNTDGLDLYIKSKTSEKTLAKWGSIRGIQIEE